MRGAGTRLAAEHGAQLRLGDDVVLHRRLQVDNRRR
jgi:hypothetical protein